MISSKQIAFIALMSALGNVLAGISINIAPILAATSPGGGGAALDLSHIATFIAAIFGGPVTGAVVGFLGGIYSGYSFGFTVGSLGFLSLIGLPVGKAITGFVAGLLYKGLKINQRLRPSTLTVAIVLLSYIPEFLFTVAYFLYLVLLFYGNAMAFMLPIVLPKAWIEIILISFLMGALVGNVGFRDFVSRFFASTAGLKNKTSKQRSATVSS
jgi:LytS/YehU family sensor histidine kinase